MSKLGRHVRGFLALLSFLTIIPTQVYDVVLASRYFYIVPLVGVIEGLITALPILLSIPLILKALLATLLMYVLTGFMHIDGFADFIDALASGKRGEEALRIMKEAWRGSIAIASVNLLILTSFVSLNFLVITRWFILIIIAQILASESMFILARISKSSPYEGLGRLFITQSKTNNKTLLSVVLTLIVILLFLTIPSLVSSFRFLIVILTSIIMSVTTILTIMYTHTKSHDVLGFVNGDALGFCFELSRTLNLLTASVIITLLG